MTGIPWALLLLLVQSSTFAAADEIRAPCESDVCPHATCNNCTATISLSCPLLTTTLVEGAESHQDCVCVPGAFGAAGAACTPCPYGTYAALPNQLECTPCLYGVLQNTTGATNASVCAAAVYEIVVTMSLSLPLNVSEMDSLRQLISTLLNISTDAISIDQNENGRRRRLLSATLTIVIPCISAEQLEQLSALINPPVVASWFTQAALTAPSLIVIQLVRPTSPTTTTPDTTLPPREPVGTTPGPTPTPPLDSSVSTQALTPAIIGAAAGGVVALGLGVWVAFCRGGRQGGAGKQLGTLPGGMAAPARTQMQLFHRVRVVR